jgi:hypothetical protein
MKISTLVRTELRQSRKVVHVTLSLKGRVFCLIEIERQDFVDKSVYISNNKGATMRQPSWFEERDRISGCSASADFARGQG